MVKLVYTMNYLISIQSHFCYYTGKIWQALNGFVKELPNFEIVA